MPSRNLYFAAIIACMTGALFGYSVGFIGGVLVLPSFLHHFRLDQLPSQDVASAQSKIVSSWLIGCVVGVPLSVPVCSKFGRRLCINFSAGLYIIGALLQLIDVHRSLTIFQLGRFLNGVGVGAGTLVSPIYISEISPPSQRSALMSGYQVAIQIFALIGFWGAFVCNSVFDTTSNLQWQVPVLVQFFPSITLLVGSILILPESPRWLMTNNKPLQAGKALEWLRMEPSPNSPIITAEFTQIQKLVDAGHQIQQNPTTRKPFLTQILTRPLRKRMSLGILIMIFQNLVGLNALNYFSPIIFMSAGFTSVSTSLFLTGLFGLVKLITALLFMFIFVRVHGNRFWLQLGTAVMAVCMFTLAFCISQMNTTPQQSPSDPTDTTNPTITVYGITCILSIYLFSLAFGVSLGPISWNICAEIFPAHLTTKACAVTTTVQWLSQIFIAAVTPPLIEKIGWGTYVVYGVFCTVAFAWCWGCVPETRGVGVGEEMDRVFGDEGVSKRGGGDVQVVEVVEVEDIDDEVDEETPLLAAAMAQKRRRRRSSVALVV